MPHWIVQYLWLIPALPIAAAACTAVMSRRQRVWSVGCALAAMILSLILSLVAFGQTLAAGPQGQVFREVVTFPWMQLGEGSVPLGWVLDPLTAMMLVMVTIVGLLIFVFSIGYMADDKNFVRFFCFLSLFAGAMLGVVIANSLLLLFICWELVGLASYLLIGFWFQKPSAAAAAKKAFITTRIGDLGLLIGMVWLYATSGTLLFYDHGQGCLEQTALTGMVGQMLGGGLAVSTAIGLLIFCGAMGKSGQFPLHVWLPDAMEGPTPVSALIHAATMVAAGVFLVARVFPLMAITAGEGAMSSVALQCVTWVGAFTAFFAATIAVAQNDIKRILAYSTVSQLGYMMMGLGVGGVGIGMFHLITHAFFKALLFLGAGSIIHGCHHEQDIRRMGGLRRLMPLTFFTYSIGMLALAGVPLFAGFWSKDEILHAAHGWSVSLIPFYLGLAGAFLTAFYMARQMSYVFLGTCRGGSSGEGTGVRPQESSWVMVVPLAVLSLFAGFLGLLGTPFKPWFQAYLGDYHGAPAFWGTVGLMVVSTTIVFLGLGLGWWLYGRRPIEGADDEDVLARALPRVYAVLQQKFFVDELYALTVIRWQTQFARGCDWMDRYFWENIVRALSVLTLGLGWCNRLADELILNRGFDVGCEQVRSGGRTLSKVQNGWVQRYLRILALSFAGLLLLLTWGCSG